MINLQSVSVVLGVDPFSVNVSPPPLEHTEERKSSSLFVEQWQKEFVKAWLNHFLDKSYNYQKSLIKTQKSESLFTFRCCCTHSFRMSLIVQAYRSSNRMMTNHCNIFCAMISFRHSIATFEVKVEVFQTHWCFILIFYSFSTHHIPRAFFHKHKFVFAQFEAHIDSSRFLKNF